MTFHSNFHHDDTVTIDDTLYHPSDLFLMTKEEVEYFLKNISQEYINHDNYYESMNLIRRMRKFLGEV